jgi:hypothetical protein
MASPTVDTSPKKNGPKGNPPYPHRYSTPDSKWPRHSMDCGAGSDGRVKRRDPLDSPTQEIGHSSEEGDGDDKPCR